MTSMDDLRRRAEAAEGRFGAMHDRARDYSDRLLKVMTGVEGRMAEQHERIADLEDRLARSEAENEELRRMMHSLLLAIEGGNVGSDEPERLGPALRDLEARVEHLMAPAAPPRPALAAAGGAGMMAAIAAIPAPAQAAEDIEDEPPLELTADLVEHLEEEPASGPEPAWDLAPEPPAQPATVDEDPLDLAMPEEAPAVPTAEGDRGFTFSDEEPVAPAEDDFTFDEPEPEPAAEAEPTPPHLDAAEPEGLSPEDIAALLGPKPGPAETIPADDADDASWDDALELDMAEPAPASPQPAPPPAGKPALSEADTALMNSIMATIRQNTTSAAAPEPVATDDDIDLDIDLDRLLSEAADDERAKGQAAAPRSAFDALDIPPPAPEPVRPNDAHAPDFDPEIDAILQHVRKGIAMPGKN